jgi:hypothetical protein
MARGAWQVVFKELPPGVSSARVLSEIGVLLNPQPKPGKKAIEQATAQLKALMASQLDRARDESGKDDDVRLVFEPTQFAHRPQRVRRAAARAYQPRDLGADQPGGGRHRRPAVPEIARRPDRRVVHLPPADRSSADRSSACRKPTTASTFSKVGTSSFSTSTK